MASYERLSDWKARLQSRFPSADPKIWDAALPRAILGSGSGVRDMQGIGVNGELVVASMDSQGGQHGSLSGLPHSEDA